MPSMFAVLGRFSIRFRWLVIAGWLVAAAASVAFLPSITAAVNNNNTQFLPASAPSNVAERLAVPFYGASNNDNVLVVAATRDHRKLTSADDAAIQRLTTLAARLPHARTARLAEFSGDGQAARIVINAALSQRTNTSDVTFVRSLRALFPKTVAPPDLMLHTAGDLAVTADQAKQANTLGSRTVFLSIMLIVVVLLAVFRSPLATLATLLPAVVVLLTAESVIAEMASLGVGISSITQFLLIVLVLGAGTDYGLFLVFRVREERRRGLSPHQAIERAVERVGESVVFSAATVIAALLSLLLATFGVYHGLAIPLAIGIGFMVLAGVTLVPAALAASGWALFWPAQPAAGQRTSGAWGRLAGRVVRRPAIALLIGVLGLSVLAGFSLADRSSNFSGGISAPPGTDSAQGQALLVEHFSLASSNPINLVMTFRHPVWSDPQVLAAAQDSLRHAREFSSLITPLYPNRAAITPAGLTRLHRILGPPAAVPAVQPTRGPAAALPPALYQAYRATAQVIAPDGRTVQFLASLKAGGPDSNAAISEVPLMRSDLAVAATRAHASAAGVAGDSPSLYDVRSASRGDLVRLVPVAVLVIGLLLALLLRSVVAPLYLVVSVVLSYLSSLGASVIVFQVFGGDYGLSFVLPFLMFVFLLALGEDYNILVMSRIREEAHDLPLRDAVVRAIEVTGSTVTSAGTILGGTFLVSTLAGASGTEGAQIREIGVGLAIGVALDTFVVRTLIVPAVVVLLGRWNWWPSSLHDRHLVLERHANQRTAERIEVELAGEAPVA
ncbi:MAG TPA: MMPL family transporter [Streptosporangiaceae bacterium]|nr:MMPL family transporter [Streptosporangiaceae bacterium]